MLDGCIIESNSIIAAGSVVLEGTHVKSGSLYAGVPAKFRKEVQQDLIAGEIQRIANNYVKYSGWFKEGNQSE